MVLAERADAIVIATGATPGLPPIPGIMDSRSSAPTRSSAARSAASLARW